MNKRIFLMGISLILLALVGNGCGSTPILRQDIEKMKRTHLLGAMVVGPNSYSYNADDTSAGEVDASVWKRCREVKPMREKWTVKGTCENCGLSWKTDLVEAKKVASLELEKNLRSNSGVGLAAVSQTNSISGVSEIQATLKKALDSSKDLAADQWEDELSSITDGEAMKKLLADNPNDAFMIVVLHMTPETGGREIFRKAQDRWDPCEYIITTEPVKDGIHLKLSGTADLRFNTKPGDNQFLEAMKTTISDLDTVDAFIPSRKAASLSKDVVENNNAGSVIPSLGIEQSEDKKASQIGLFTAVAGSYTTGNVERQIVSDVQKNMRVIGGEFAGAMAEFIHNEKQEAMKKQ